MDNENQQVKSGLLRLLRELFLLTLGIYLALVINNWNEDRKDRNAEQFYLTKVLEDVNRSIANLEFHLALNENQLQGAKRLDQLLDQGNLVNKDSLKIYLNSFNRNPRFQNANYSYQSLLQSGDYPLIKNRNLRTALDEFYLNDIPNVIITESYYLDRLHQHFFPVKEQVYLGKLDAFLEIERLFDPIFREHVFVLPPFIQQEMNQIKGALVAGRQLKLALESAIYDR